MFECVLCDRIFATEDSYRQHQRDSPAHNPKCTACNITFSNRNHWIIHMAQVHINRFCVSCSREFTSTDALYQHTTNSVAHRTDTDDENDDNESEEEDEEDEEDDDDDDNMMESLFHEYLRHLILTQANMENEDRRHQYDAHDTPIHSHEHHHPAHMDSHPSGNVRYMAHVYDVVRRESRLQEVEPDHPGAFPVYGNAEHEHEVEDVDLDIPGAMPDTDNLDRAVARTSITETGWLSLVIRSTQKTLSSVMSPIWSFIFSTSITLPNGKTISPSPPPSPQRQDSESSDSPKTFETHSGAGHSRCPLCLDLEKDVSSLACGHVFGTKCIQRALRYKFECPVCRRAACACDLRRLFLVS